MNLNNKVIFITGASRGIGREIALRVAKDKANVVIAAKTASPHPSLSGTIYSVAEEVEKLGGKALPLIVDVRDEAQVQDAIDKTVNTYGGLDILVNNASAIDLSNTVKITMKKFDLIQAVNTRATFMCSKLAITHLKQSTNPHILTLSPPLNMQPRWFKDHLGYTISKYGMSMCTLGLAEELRKSGIAVNSLWPKSLIATSAIQVNFPALYAACRKPSIVADAAYCILTSDSKAITGQFLIDEDVLRSHGITDFTSYEQQPGQTLYPDLFL